MGGGGVCVQPQLIQTWSEEAQSFISRFNTRINAELMIAILFTHFKEPSFIPFISITSNQLFSKSQRSNVTDNEEISPRFNLLRHEAERSRSSWIEVKKD